MFSEPRRRGRDLLDDRWRLRRIFQFANTNGQEDLPGQFRPGEGESGFQVLHLPPALHAQPWLGRA